MPDNNRFMFNEALQEMVLQALPANERGAMDTWYDQVVLSVPLYQNPALIIDLDFVEVLIECRCGGRYRVLINAATPICSFAELGALVEIRCRNCNYHAHSARAFYQHSAGTFNLSVERQVSRSWGG